jgi:cephalosporin hydroxylase
MLSVTDRVTEAFHQRYYAGAEQGLSPLFHTYWMGFPIVKCPLDMWIYQEILFETRPDFIIEAGTYNGGSAYYLAHLCDILGRGEVVTIDIRVPGPMPKHPRITYLSGSSTAPEIVQQVHALARGKSSVMVILDSDHAQTHVYNEMRAYHSLVSPGNYMIVEDTNVNGHPVRLNHGPGPMEAIEQFMRENQDFAVDHTREKFLLTMNPSGYLRKKR